MGAKTDAHRAALLRKKLLKDREARRKNDPSRKDYRDAVKESVRERENAEEDQEPDEEEGRD